MAEGPSADIERGRAHYARRRWADAFDALRKAQKVSPLQRDDLTRLVWSAALIGDDDEFLRNLELLHQDCAEADASPISPTSRKPRFDADWTRGSPSAQTVERPRSSRLPSTSESVRSRSELRVFWAVLGLSMNRETAHRVRGRSIAGSQGNRRLLRSSAYRVPPRAGASRSMRSVQIPPEYSAGIFSRSSTRSSPRENLPPV